MGDGVDLSFTPDRAIERQAVHGQSNQCPHPVEWLAAPVRSSTSLLCYWAGGIAQIDQLVNSHVFVHQRVGGGGT